MKKVNSILKSLLNKNEQYVWYACYGSNINYNRFKKYITGGKYATKNGCSDKSEPLEFKKYIFNHPIYFAGESKNWTGGMAFLDYKEIGKSYGKIYKIKTTQFKDIYNQENELYNYIVLLDSIENLPVLTFTSKNKLSNLLNNPSLKYVEVIGNGLKELDYNLTDNQINNYLKNREDV